MSTLEDTLTLASGSYSEDRYTDWSGVATALLDRGYSPEVAVAIMRSKITRWAADAYEQDHGICDAGAVLRYIDEPRHNITPAFIESLLS